MLLGLGRKDCVAYCLTREALAEAKRVVADAPARAVAALLVAPALEHVGARRTLLCEQDSHAQQEQGEKLHFSPPFHAAPGNRCFEIGIGLLHAFNSHVGYIISVPTSFM
jgi:hypothetical protein